MAKKQVKEVAVIPAPPQRTEVILEGNPKAQLEYATKAANALMGVVKKKPHPIIINNKQYLEFGDWQVLARFYGATVEIEWTHPIYEKEGSEKIIGYEARALVKRQGEIISSAEGMCMRDEKRWSGADEYAVRSMAQTRTAAKALRNAFGWVAELAGYSATPAEEMPQEERKPMKSYAVPRVTYPAMDESNDVAPLKEEPKQSTGAAKMEIARLLLKNHKYTMLGKSAKDVSDKIFDITSLNLEESNFPAIIERLATIE